MTTSRTTPDSLVTRSHPSLERLECVSTIVARDVVTVQWLAMVRRNLRERDRDVVPAAGNSKHEHRPRTPRHRDEKSVRGSRDLQESRPDLAVRAPGIDEYADDRVLRLQKVDYLSLRWNRRPTTVHPDGEAVPGNRLLQRSRLRPIVSDRQRNEVTRKIPEYADSDEFVRVPGKTDDRSRPVFEQSDQLRRIWLPPNPSRPPRRVQAARHGQVRDVNQWLQQSVEDSSSMRCV